MSDDRDNVANANSTIATTRSPAPPAAWPSTPTTTPPSHNGTPARARIEENLFVLPGAVSIWLGMLGSDGLQLDDWPLQVHGMPQ